MYKANGFTNLIIICISACSFFLFGCSSTPASSSNISAASTTYETSEEVYSITADGITQISEGAAAKSDMSDSTMEVENWEDIQNHCLNKDQDYTVAETEDTPLEYNISLMAVGDNLMHMGIIYTGLQNDGSYDFTSLYDGIDDFLNKADIKIINQETIFAGNNLGFSGYPYFNSPTQVGDALAEVGFNVVLQSSNHSLDQGVAGIDYCVNYWTSHPEILLSGIHTPYDETTDEISRIPILTINDKKFAILNYTYAPNYGSASPSVENRMNILCSVNQQSHTIDYTSLNPQVIKDITTAEQIADIVIVCPHWGTEYATTPSSYQQKFAMEMTEAGADLIIGTHPHVVEPVELITASNGNKALCYYSLGNYVSTQKDSKSMLEAMAWVNFHVNENGVSLSLEDSGVIPLVCHYSSNPVRLQRVYLLEDYTEELAASHGIRSYGGVTMHLNDLLDLSDSILGDWVIPAAKALN